MYPPTLQWYERLYHRDQLRAGRYAALADAEGFLTICFALEALGLRLLGKKKALKEYGQKLAELARDSVVLEELTKTEPARFTSFEALFDLVRTARNDAMHSGVYARHATAAAIELCIGLEESLMKQQQHPRQLVQDFMVKSPVIVEPWQPVAHARQLMLTHSFSYLPVLRPDGWQLISEAAMARYMRSNPSEWSRLLATSIEEACGGGLGLVAAPVANLDQDIDSLLREPDKGASPQFWLVLDGHARLCGVLSPFELM